MNTTSHLRRLPHLLALLLCVATPTFAASSPAMDHVREFLSQGTFSLDLRARYERVGAYYQTEPADALTLGTRIGYQTPSYRGLVVMVQAENVASPMPNAYSQSGINDGGDGKAVVTDPVGTEINQAWLQYTYGKTSVKAGRQRMQWDNGRFIGDHAWRQNMQTFDAIVLENDSLDDFTFTYAYLDRVNRVYGHDHPQGVYESNSHLLHAVYHGLSVGAVTGYVYLMEFGDPVVANSTATYGLSFDGSRNAGDVKIGYRLDYAYQSNYGDSPLYYSANYLAAEVNATWGRFSGGLGYELQGHENNFAFRAPLGSLHEFNGWADAFLLTPSVGLHDFYVHASANVWWNVGLTAVYHTFDSDTGQKLGNEIDLLATYPINDSLRATLKFASFSSKSNLLFDSRKLWLQGELTF